MFTTKRINDHRIKKIKPKHQPVDSKGMNIIDIYTNTFLVARKKSGKTTALFNLLKATIDKNTFVYLFCNTVNKDQSYDVITSWMEDHDIEFQTFTSVKEGKEDHLGKIVSELEAMHNEGGKHPDYQEEDLSRLDGYPGPICVFGENEIKITIPRERKKPLTPKLCFVFDDISQELRTNTNVRKLLKQNRHYLCNTIISSQNPLDLYTDSRNQIDNWMVFKGFNEKKLQAIYESADPSIDYHQWRVLYNDATADRPDNPKGFLYYQRAPDRYRRNFNYEYFLT